jgi:hypothetical protein
MSEKSPRPAQGGGLSPACRRLINSGCRASNTPILLQLIQQFAGFADGQIFGDISVKPLVNQFLCVQTVVPSRQQPDDLHDKRHFHGCVYLSETSCKSMNDFLDRNLVVRTIAANRRHFFEKR